MNLRCDFFLQLSNFDSAFSMSFLFQSNSQAIRLGQRFRQDMYPDSPGGGILRLHSTFRHDLKIKTSDEGRVMKTGAAFAKGLLELEGEIPPILVSLVHKEKGRYVDPLKDFSRRKPFDSQSMHFFFLVCICLIRQETKTQN